MEISKKVFQEAAFRADLTEEDIHWDYSGRGMFGRSCPGFVGSVADFGLFMIYLNEELRNTPEDEIPFRVARMVTTDSMGYSTIFYFPGLRIVEED
jgi:hypothetical protein